jgi:uncharacterized membrane-anchored protein YhcB (DUF1043 family)
MSEFKFAETPKSSDQGQVKTQKWGMNVVILGMFVVLMVSILVMGVIFIRLYSETVKAFKIQLEDVKTAYLKKNEKLQQDLEHFAKLMEQSQKEKQSLKAELSKAIASGDEEKSKMYEKLSAQYDTVLAQMKIEKQKQEEAFNTRLASYEQKIQTLMNEGKSKEEAMEEALKDYMVPSPSPTNPPAGEIPSTLGNPADPLALENPEGEGGGVSGEVKEVNPFRKNSFGFDKSGGFGSFDKSLWTRSLSDCGFI